MSSSTLVDSNPVSRKEMIQVRVQSCTGESFHLEIDKHNTSSSHLRALVADKFQVHTSAVELTSKGHSIDSQDGMIAVRSGCTINVVPKSRTGLDTLSNLSVGTVKKIKPEEIFGLLQNAEGSDAKVTIVFSGENGPVTETELPLSDAVQLIRAAHSNPDNSGASSCSEENGKNQDKITANTGAPVCSQNIASNATPPTTTTNPTSSVVRNISNSKRKIHGDTAKSRQVSVDDTGNVHADKNTCATSRIYSLFPDQSDKGKRMKINPTTTSTDATHNLFKSPLTSLFMPSTQSASACATDQQTSHLSDNDCENNPHAIKPDDDEVTIAMKKRARFEDECRRATKDIHDRKMENIRTARTLEALRRKREAKKLRRMRHLQKKERDNACIESTKNGTGANTIETSSHEKSKTKKSSNPGNTHKTTTTFAGMRRGFFC